MFDFSMQVVKIMERKSIFIGILIVFLFGGCTVPYLLSQSTFDSDVVVAQKATIIMQITRTAEALETPTSGNITPISLPTATTQCTYAWALKADDELNEIFQAALPEDMVAEMELTASWYGENCLDVNTNYVVHFTAMNLEVSTTFTTKENQTDAWKGEQIALIMENLLTTIKETPDISSYPVLFHFVFSQDGKLQYITFNETKFQEMKEERGLTGEDLFQALRQ
jgi:hypothetical protein